MNKNKTDLDETVHDKRFELLFEKTKLGAYRSSPDGRLLTANKAMVEMLGFKSLHEIEGGNLNLISKAKKYPREKFIKAMETEGLISSLELTMENNSGEMLFLRESAWAVKDDSGRTVYYEGIVEDISELKNVEQELNEEREKLAATVGSLEEGVVTLDSLGRIIYLNKSAESITGLKKNKAINMDFADVTGIRDIENKNPFLYIFKNEKNSELTVEVTKTPILGRSRKNLGSVVVFRNITEKIQLEEEQIRSSRLDSLGILAGGIAHEFNNLLTAVLGNISLAKLEADPGGKIFERLTEAEKCYQQARLLTQRLLTFSKGGSPFKQRINLCELLRESSDFSFKASKIKGKVNIPDDEIFIEGDIRQIEQVINNIIINADESMPDGGKVDISLSMCGKCPELKGLREDCEYARITVKDRGVGIPQKLIQKIFDPYFTTKQKGSGLGLASAYSIIKNHNGRITVKSSPGEGSVFSVYLPVSREKNEKGKIEKPCIPGIKGRVLVMDDEEIVRYVAVKMLEHLGYEVDDVEDGIKAIELYKKSMSDGRAYNCVIADLTVPGGMGGKEAIRTIMEFDPDVKAIISSGYSNDPVMSEYQKFGFLGVIRKPYTIEELGRAVASVLEDRESMDKR